MKDEQKLSRFWAGKWTVRKPTLWLLRMMALRSTIQPHGQLTDEILITRTARGDAAALGILYDRYAATVLGITLKITQDRALAENLLQETFWQVWQRASIYRPENGSVNGWLFRMARTLAMEADRNMESASDG